MLPHTLQERPSRPRLPFSLNASLEDLEFMHRGLQLRILCLECRYVPLQLLNSEIVLQNELIQARYCCDPSILILPEGSGRSPNIVLMLPA